VIHKRLDSEVLMPHKVRYINPRPFTQHRTVTDDVRSSNDGRLKPFKLLE